MGGVSTFSASKSSATKPSYMCKSALNVFHVVDICGSRRARSASIPIVIVFFSAEAGKVIVRDARVIASKPLKKLFFTL